MTEIAATTEAQPTIAMDVENQNSNSKQPAGDAPAEQAPRKRRKNMFDMKPEDIGEEPLVESLDQPLDSGAGELVHGPGAGGLQARFNEAKKSLPKIERHHEEKLAQAKRFAMEQSVQHVLAKQKIVQAPDVASNLHSSAQRQRALALMCRVYIGSINFQLDEEAVRASFLPFGPIRMIDLSRDSTTGKHKGFAFVEYELAEAAQLALEQMNNVMMGGRNIKVGRPSNVPQAAPWIDQILDEARQYARIYASSIHPDLTESDIKSVFEAFGNVLSCKLSPDQLTGKHKGYGFIEYSTQQSANDAIVAMNLFDLGGQYIRVGRAITPPNNPQAQGPPPAASMLAASVISATLQGQETVSTHGASALLKNPLNPTVAATSVMQPAASSPMQMHNTTISGVGQNMNGNTGSPQLSSYGQSTTAMSTTVSSQPIHSAILNRMESDVDRDQKKMDALMQQKPVGENLEREEKLEISGKDARYMMMQKLARGSASGVIVLRNMVTIDEVDEDLEEEVTEECSRFGEVTKVIIYQEKQGEEEFADVIVKIFVEFKNPDTADTAQAALDGRWFGGRAIQAHVYDEDKFKAQDYTG